MRLLTDIIGELNTGVFSVSIDVDNSNFNPKCQGVWIIIDSNKLPITIQRYLPTYKNGIVNKQDELLVQKTFKKAYYMKEF